MKTRSLIIAMAALLITSVACFATVNVYWFTFGTLSDPSTSADLAAGSLAQLIWSPTASIDALLESSPTTPQGDDILLDSLFISTPGRIFESAREYDATLAGAWGGAGTYAEDYFVGGYVYSRVFNSATPGAGTWYLDAPATLAGALGDQDPATGSPATPTDCDPTGGTVAILDQQIGAVPEPTTWAFMGIGLLTIAIRRKMRK